MKNCRIREWNKFYFSEAIMKRTILLAILTVSFLTMTVLAQNADDKVLVDGNPALTQKMVNLSRDVFEFTFGAAMTDEERAFYQNELIREWRAKDAATIQAIQDLVSLQAKAANLNREQILALQKELRSSLIKELRAQVNQSPLAKMLVNAYDRIQGLNVKQGGDLPPQNNVRQQNQTSSSGAIPREILGEWIKSDVSGSYITDGINFSTPNGEKLIIHFYADGTYKSIYHVQSSMSIACTMIVDIFSNGVYSVGKNTLYLNEKYNHTSSKDSCVARYNYERDNQPKNYAYPAYIEPSENGTRLVLTMTDGKHHFYFNTGKSFISGK
jgi:hypothetical protein